MRSKIYQILESSSGNSASKIYNVFMMMVIILSVIPLAFKETYAVFNVIESVTALVFIIDYILRLITADLKLKKSALSFVVYPFTPMAVIDFLSILPSLTVLHGGFKLLKIIRFMRTLKIFRTFKFFRYSKSFEIIVNVFKKQKHVLVAVATMAVAYVFVSALVIYNVEPESFDTFFDAVYWATVSLTTVGYGDIYPITAIGRVVIMISSVFGIAVIALPSGVITAGYLSEVSKKEESSEKNQTE